MPIDIDVDVIVGLIMGMDGGDGNCEMAKVEVVEDAMDCALPLPDTAMEACRTDM